MSLPNFSKFFLFGGIGITLSSTSIALTKAGHLSELQLAIIEVSCGLIVLIGAMLGLNCEEKTKDGI